MCLGAEMSRVCFESWAEKVDGPRCLGTEVVVGPKCLNTYASYCLVSIKIRLKILLPYIYLRPKVLQFLFIADLLLLLHFQWQFQLQIVFRFSFEQMGIFIR